jgi:RHS repeat-associated protein
VLARSQIQEVFPLAACLRLAENSRLGFGPVASTSQWGSGFSISSSTLGLSASLYDGRVRPRSTGKERDTESGNDYFEARYYSSQMGRFMSPDLGGPVPNMPDAVPWADFDNPQSLNLYSYVLNNPLTNADSDGHDVNVCDIDRHCHEMSNDQYKAAQQTNNQGGLNAPTLDQVGMNGNGSGQFYATNITDTSGKVVGTATYISDGGADYYANRNGIDFINTKTAPVVNAIGWGTVGLMGVLTGAEFVGGAGELTTLGDITATPTAGELSAAENTLATGGRKGVEKAIQTLSRRIAEHQEKLKTISGNPGSIERELATWRRAIVALQQVLK